MNKKTGLPTYQRTQYLFPHALAADHQSKYAVICYVYAVILIDNRNNHDPYVHAAIEEYIVRHMDTSQTDYVMLYINEPCIVVGKNQSIYKEVSFDYLRLPTSKIVRRISGGGTVYHDEGNLCFAFLSKFDDKKVNNYRYFNQPIVDALHRAGIEASFSPRNDILWQGKKISGNAQFTDRKNILSHGTLLVNANLNDLRLALKANPFEVSSKAVSSVRSSVMNLIEGTDRFPTAESLLVYLKIELGIKATHSFSDAEWATITTAAMEKFESAEWTYGRNPYTIVTKPELIINIEDGKISELVFSNAKYEALNQLKGIYYTYPTVKAAITRLGVSESMQKELLEALF